MTILALETATEACSVALRLADGREFHRYVDAPRQQAKLLLPMVDEVLREAGLALGEVAVIAYSRGPGAFTGVRIAAAAAQGLAFARDLPVVAVSSLQAAARHAWRLSGYSRVLVVFDARMDEIYAGAYVLDASTRTLMPVMPERVCRPEDLTAPPGEGPWLLAGDGAAFRDVLASRIVIGDVLAEVRPHALDIAALAERQAAKGEAVSPERALPVYLRDEVWQKLPGR